VQAVGALKSEQGVMLRPEVSGRIAKLGFAEGQRVQRGQLLVQLDDTLQQAQLKAAQAQASIATTRLQRNRELQTQGFVSTSAVDQTLADVDVAQAQVALAQAQLARMKVMAPFSGTAGLRLVDVGDYVKDGADIVNIQDLSALTVQFALPERTLDRLRPGQGVELTLDALPGRSFKARVKALDSQVDANGRAVQVLARLEANPGAVLKPGMFARARVVFAVREGAVLVPEEALVPQGAKQLLFKVVDNAEGKKVAQRLEAKLGLRLAGKVEILEGVKPGDVLVTAGHNRLLRGDNLPVRVVDLARPGGAGKPGGKPPAVAPGAAGGAASGAAPAAPAGAAPSATSGAVSSTPPPTAPAPPASAPRT
jgi:membrane fusion protein, multidrug efflux system